MSCRSSARPHVLVVGAGSAGVAAAVAAARTAEPTPCSLRQADTSAGRDSGLINLLLTLDDGAGTQVVAGLCQEVVDRLESSGNARSPRMETWGSEAPELVASWRSWGLIWGAPPEAVRYSVAFDPEAFVDICYDLLEEAGAQLRCHLVRIRACQWERHRCGDCGIKARPGGNLSSRR